MKAATASTPKGVMATVISIHAAREGGDAANCMDDCIYAIFQSTPPVKAATILSEENSLGDDISIHAAREGGDLANNLLR